MMVSGSSISANLVPLVGTFDLGYLFSSFELQTKAFDAGALRDRVMVMYLVAARIDLDQLMAAIEAYHRANMSGDGRQGGRHDQVDRYCLLCLWRRSLGASDDSRPDSSAGCRHHTSCRGLRPGQDDGERCVRGQNHQPPRAPRGPQVCAMERRRLRRVALKARRRVHRKSDANFSSRQSQPCFQRDEGQQCGRVEPRSQAARLRTRRGGSDGSYRAPAAGRFVPSMDCRSAAIRLPPVSAPSTYIPAARCMRRCSA